MSWSNDSNGIPQASNPTVGADAAVAVKEAIAQISTLITSANASITSLTSAIATALRAANNLSDLSSAATARTNLGLGSAATHAAGDFDASGAAATAQSNAETYASNASHLSSGTVATARLGTGTANNTVYLRGDGAWATPSGGGGGVVSAVTNGNGLSLSGGTLSFDGSGYDASGAAATAQAAAQAASLPLSGGTMSGALSLGGNQLTGVGYLYVGQSNSNAAMDLYGPINHQACATQNMLGNTFNMNNGTGSGAGMANLDGATVNAANGGGGGGGTWQMDGATLVNVGSLTTVAGGTLNVTSGNGGSVGGLQAFNDGTNDWIQLAVNGQAIFQVSPSAGGLAQVWAGAGWTTLN